MKGIYYIRCTYNKKVYIGSSINIEQRIKKHLWKLKNNKHENVYFQNIYNKYGYDSLKMGVVELCDNLLEKEQYYINNNQNLINIVVRDVTRPSINQEIKDKISKTLKEKYKKGLIKNNSGEFKKGMKPWNTGKKYKSTNHLKVPKTITEKSIKGKNKAIKTRRNKLPKIEVYQSDGKTLIAIYENTVELYNDSIKHNFILQSFMKLRNPKGRNNLSPYVLQSVNVMKSTRTNKEYKGLIFKICHPNK